MMNNELQDKLIAMKYSLQNDIANKTGKQCQVNIRQLGTKRLDSLVRFDIITNNPNNPFGYDSQSFDVFVDRKGIVYWDRAIDMNEDVSMKTIN